jgi:hypothetical protein
MIDLPLEKLADAVAALRNEVWNRPDQERRALPRIRVWAPRTIHLQPVAPGQPAAAMEVWLVDLACGGVGFLAPRPLDAGLEFHMTLPSMESEPVTLLCRVLHSQPAPNSAFIVGARFVRELAEAEIAEPLRQAS